MSLPSVTIYTDGACSGNPGPGGWGAILYYHNINKKLTGYELNTTNNRMEITAAIEALRALKTACQVKIYTDSKYLQQGVTTWMAIWVKNNWHKSNNQAVKNVDLWQNLAAALGKHDILWHWVKGHANNAGNIIADQLAAEGKEIAMRMLKKPPLER